MSHTGIPVCRNIAACKGSSIHHFYDKIGLAKESKVIPESTEEITVIIFAGIKCYQEIIIAVRKRFVYIKYY